MELHCPVICITNDNRIFIAKRNKNRKIYPNLWEFGCGKPNENESMIDTIKREYKEDFNVDIDIITSASKGKNPVPISTYEIEKDGKLCKGVVLLGRIRNPEVIKLSDKHSEFKLISRDYISTIKDNECVPDFRYNLMVAFNLFSHTV